jgi:hypothetical protein
MRNLFFAALLLVATFPASGQTPAQKAPAPLYRDPVYDGPADPIIVWNADECSWWILYTQRRANMDAAGVAYCYGTDIAVASSRDNGRTWSYRGTLDLETGRGRNTFWAPAVVCDRGTYHMFVAYIEGSRTRWGGEARMAHYTSSNLWDWRFEGFAGLPTTNVIDATVFQMPSGEWRMWYKDDARGASINLATSTDLHTWKPVAKPVLNERKQEGPVVFRLGGWYWMLTDEWSGMAVYRSKDADTWQRQEGRILDKPSARPEDGPSGAHGDVVVVGDRAYAVYFTHPGRKFHLEDKPGPDGILPYNMRRSSLQAAELRVENGNLLADRSADFNFYLPDQTVDVSTTLRGALKSAAAHYLGE